MRTTQVLLLIASSLVAGCGSSNHAGNAGGSTVGCDNRPLLANPTDLAAPGPWPVGVQTATVGGLTTEIWYPATPGSDTGMATEQYDLRKELPPSEAVKISDADNPLQPCDCVRGLPLDTSHGPYPVIVFVHGTASFRHQSLHIVTHWASRGFVVVAADHPGLKLGDLLASACGGTAPAQNLSGDIDTLIAAIDAPSGDLAFLAGAVDPTRLAITGHSAGAGAAASSSSKPGVQVVISMAGVMSDAASATLRSSLYFGGLLDSIASWNQVMTAWTGAVSPKRLVGIDTGGHLTFSDLCQIKNSAGNNILQIAEADGVCGANLAGFLFDCDPSHIDGQTGWDIVNYASSAVLENVLACQAPIDLSTMSTHYPDVTQYQEAL